MKADIIASLRDDLASKGAAFVKVTPDGTTTSIDPEEGLAAKAKFDRNAYQREYMRKRRAAKGNG